MEEIDFGGKEEGADAGGRMVSVEEANAYMQLVRDVSGRMALAVSILILSPICLLFLGGAAECFGIISENAAGGIGLVILLLMVAVGVGLPVPCGMRLDKYKYLEEEEIILAYGVEGIVEKRRSEEEESYRKKITLGVILCILAMLPLFVATGFDGSDFLLVVCVNLLFAVVSLTVNIFIRTGMVYGAYETLLQIGGKPGSYGRRPAYCLRPLRVLCG